MRGWKQVLVTAGLAAGSLAVTVPAFAATNQPVTQEVMVSSGETSLILNFPTLQGVALTPPQTLQFEFTTAPPGVTSSTAPIYETGTLYESSPAVSYKIPVPNYGHTQNVYVSMTYTSPDPNSKYYAETVGPLLDTLPEVPLAAALPLGMLGVWFVMRKRRLNAAR